MATGYPNFTGISSQNTLGQWQPFDTPIYGGNNSFLRPRPTMNTQPVGPITPAPIAEPVPPGTETENNNGTNQSNNTGNSGTGSGSDSNPNQEVVDAVAQSGITTGDPTGNGPVYGTTPWSMSFWRRPPSDIRGYFEGVSGGSRYSPEDIAYLSSLLRLPSIGSLKYQYG